MLTLSRCFFSFVFYFFFFKSRGFVLIRPVCFLAFCTRGEALQVRVRGLRPTLCQQQRSQEAHARAYIDKPCIFARCATSPTRTPARWCKHMKVIAAPRWPVWSQEPLQLFGRGRAASGSWAVAGAGRGGKATIPSQTSQKARGLERGCGHPKPF